MSPADCKSEEVLPAVLAGDGAAAKLAAAAAAAGFYVFSQLGRWV